MSQARPQKPTAAPAARAEPTALGSGWLWALLALALARGGLYTFVVPPWQHPDEPPHFEHVRALAETGRFHDENYVSLPMRWEIALSMQRHGFWRGLEQPPLNDETLSEPSDSLIGLNTFTQPRLYYVLAAAWLWPWLGQPVDLQLYVVRLLAVLLNVGIVACAYLTARLVFPGRPALAVAVAGFVVFQPGLTDIMSAANNDALANALAALFFLAVAWAYRRGWGWMSLLVIALALAGGIATKSTGVITLAALPLAVILYPWGRRTGWLVAALAGAAACLAAGLGGAILSGAAGPAGDELQTAIGRYFRIIVPDTLQAFRNPQGLQPYYVTSVVVFRSFWAVFGWRHVALAPAWYWLPGLAMLAAGAGLATQAARRIVNVVRGGLAGEDSARAGYLLFSAGAAALAWAAAILRSNAVQGIGRYLSHGRYAFVGMVPFALLVAAGLLVCLPEAWQRRGLWIYLAGWAAFDALAFWGALVPYYYLPS